MADSWPPLVSAGLSHSGNFWRFLSGDSWLGETSGRLVGIILISHGFSPHGG